MKIKKQDNMCISINVKKNKSDKRSRKVETFDSANFSPTNIEYHYDDL